MASVFFGFTRRDTNLAVPYRKRKRIKKTSTALTRMARGTLTPSAGLPSWKSAQLITELISSKREPTGAEKTCLAVFMGTMYTRTPLGRQLGDERFQTSHFADAQESCCRCH